MALPFIFANSASGTQPAANLDTNFTAVALNTIIPCTASGTNAITLTPNATAPNQTPTISGYANRLVFSFISAGASTGAVTIRVGSLAFLAAYRTDGVGLLGDGQIIAPPAIYLAIYSSELNAPHGGFFVVGGSLGWHSPQFTGFPTAPTPFAGDNSTLISTTAFVQTAVTTGGVLKEDKANKGVANGYASLDATTKVPAAQLPTLTKADVGLANVDNTSDAAKPVSTATQTALNLKAPLASPALTGVPTSPTAGLGTNTAQIATTAFVIANSAPVPPATVAPIMDSVAAVGVATKYAREDHVHPTNTANVAKAGDTMGGQLTVPALSFGSTVAASPIDLSNHIALWGTSYGFSVTANNVHVVTSGVVSGSFMPTGLQAAIGASTPDTGAFTTLSASGTVSGAGFTTLLAPYAPLASPTFTGDPKAPTATAGDNDTSIATTAFVTAAIAAGGGGGGAPPATVAPIMDGAAAVGVATKYAREDHVHPSDTSRQPLDAELTAIAGLASAADKLPYFTGASAASLATFTSYARTLVDDADAPTARTTLGLTSAATATPAALTKTDDTNVTLTLGGTPATALLQAASITAGWTGTLSATRGGFGANVNAANGVPLFASGVATFTPTSGTGDIVRVTSPTIGSPTFGGVAIAATAPPGTNTTQIATTAYVMSAVVPATATPIMDATAGVVGTATKYAREDHIHPKSWTQLTQAAYDALTPPLAGVLYVIVG